jgi:hypothetical protein
MPCIELAAYSVNWINTPWRNQNQEFIVRILSSAISSQQSDRIHTRESRRAIDRVHLLRFENPRQRARLVFF